VSRIITLTVALLRDWWRNREAVFFALLFPVILLLIFSTVFAASAPEFVLHVQNNDLEGGEPTTISADLVDALDDPEPLTVRSIPADRDVETWVTENESGGRKRVLVVPDGFAEQVRAKSGRVRIAVIRDTVQRFQEQLNDSQRQQVRQGLANAPNGSAAPAELRFLTQPDDNTAAAVRGIVVGVVAEFNYRAIGADEGTATLSAGTVGSSDLDAVDYFLPALVGLILLINGVMTVTTSVTSLRADGTLKRLVATPMRKRDWIVANLLQQTLLAFLLTGVMLVVAAVAFGTTAVPGPLAVALLVLGAIGFTAVGLTLGSLLRDPDAATSLANAIAFPLMFLSGVFWQIELMPDFLQTVARLSPLYHFHQGLRQLMIVGSTEGVAVAFGSMAVMAIVFTGLAIRLTDWEHFDA
jgi:ABC-2 type transport system permease protein